MFSFVKLIDHAPPCCFLAAHGLSQAVALPGENYNVGVVDQPVDESCGKTVVSKNGVPLRKLQIGSNNEALAFVAVRDYLEKQLCCILVQGNETNLINHNQFGLF